MRSRERASVRSRVFTRDGFTCQYCGSDGGPYSLHLDHVVPLARGGSWAEWNLVAACQTCNLEKHARLIPIEQYPVIVRVPVLLANCRQMWRRRCLRDHREYVIRSCAPDEEQLAKRAYSYWTRRLKCECRDCITAIAHEFVLKDLHEKWKAERAQAAQR